MILDAHFSEIGRSTGQELDALRRQLGVGIDPAFDYSQMTQLQKKLAQKKDKKKGGEDAHEDPGGTIGGLDQLRRALREVVGSGNGAADEQANEENEGGERGGHGMPLSPAEIRKLRDSKRQTSAFKNRSREDLKKLQDGFVSGRAPPMGTYAPKEFVSRPRLVCHDWGLRDPVQSRTTVQLEQEIARLQAEKQPWEHLVKPVTSTELLEEIPERVKPRLGDQDISKGVDRPDPVKSGGIVFNTNSFTTGVLEGDLQTSAIPRKPQWDFGKSQATGGSKTLTNYFQPGQYKIEPAIKATRARDNTKNMPFEKQQKRKQLKEVVGRVELNGRAGDHLPDRSLSRSAPCLSSQHRLHLPTFEHYSNRKGISNDVPEYHRRDSAEADASVMSFMSTFDLMETSKVLSPRAKTGLHFDRNITRQVHMKGSRSYGTDVCLARVKDNVSRLSPPSVELLSEIDKSPSLMKRIKSNMDFQHMYCREKASLGSTPNRHLGARTSQRPLCSRGARAQGKLASRRAPLAPLTRACDQQEAMNDAAVSR